MRRVMLLLAVSSSALTSPVLSSNAVDRIASVVDEEGTTSEVTDLRIAGGRRNILANIFDNYPSGSTVVVLVDPFELGIPLRSIMSIDIGKAGLCTVKYYSGGQKREVSGKLTDFGVFEGKTDFGDFQLDIGKLRRLTFKDTPSSFESKKPASSYDTILVLIDGSRVPVADFRRFNSYCSSEGYAIGCGDRYRYLVDFRFLRGSSLQTVLFEKIRSIEFHDFKFAGHLQGHATVTLKNGKSATGKLTYGVHDADVDGYTGIYEESQGPFFIRPGHVQSIVFVAEPK